MSAREDLIRWLDEMLPVVREQARVRVAKELQESLRRDLPRYLARLQRHAAKNPVAAAMVALFREDREKTAAFYLQNVIARDHLRKSWLNDIAREVAWRERLFGFVDPARVIDDVIEACKIAQTSYPSGAQPELPRRCDVGKAVHRYCKFGR
jgi:hypothetical protein